MYIPLQFRNRPIIIYNVICNVIYNVMYNVICNVMNNMMYNVICNVIHNVMYSVMYRNSLTESSHRYLNLFLFEFQSQHSSGSEPRTVWCPLTTPKPCEQSLRHADCRFLLANPKPPTVYEEQYRIFVEFWLNSCALTIQTFFMSFSDNLSRRYVSFRCGRNFRILSTLHTMYASPIVSTL